MKEASALLLDEEEAQYEIYPETPVIVRMHLGSGHPSPREMMMSGAKLRSAIAVASTGVGAVYSD